MYIIHNDQLYSFKCIYSTTEDCWRWAVLKTEIEESENFQKLFWKQSWQDVLMDWIQGTEEIEIKD